ncbi:MULTISPECIES: malonic semialdehyde reductase [unclassified Streptomyces]|uniref:malonic semialdehyde reductase n=1 Tax=unclassified Streptomyces TaxID=2593676 RepID=UPI000DC7DDD6|nr:MULTISPECIES: malonic semialdehyde reductase [unclassified Streptomyces]AWZ03977.1 malonic semialdehyde reductase [Streptomyces sp. ICC4]AWZ11489.1 malonic semialdehyde reductase [Streptomyces sp. ICC1]
MTTATSDRTELLTLDMAAQDLLFREARTANTFTDAPVTAAQLEAVYDLVQYAPTAMNQQPLRMLVLETRESRARLAPHLAEGNRKKTAGAPMVAILAADTAFHEHLPALFPHFPGAKDMFADDEMRADSARFNALIQVGYVILGIRAAGLAAGPMTGFDAAGVDKEFFADGRHHSLVVVNIGHPGPDAWFPRLPRLTADQVITTL